MTKIIEDWKYAELLAEIQRLTFALAETLALEMQNKETITRLLIELTNSRSNDRQAMSYLSQIREIVGGDDFPDMVRRVALLAATPSSGWQPISTAPKDGTRIIGWCGSEGYEYADICYWEQKPNVGEVWMTDSCADYGGYETPAYWMPLPLAPQGEK